MACHDGKAERERPIALTWQVSSRMVAFVMLMLVTNFALTGFARFPSVPLRDSTPASRNGWARRRRREIARIYETPLPQDWVGFATQMHHQASGGASYLWGERRMKGWWYYYFVALAVKVPLGFWLLVVARLALDLDYSPSSASAAFSFPPLQRGVRGGGPGRTNDRGFKVFRALLPQRSWPTRERSGNPATDPEACAPTPPNPPFARGGKSDFESCAATTTPNRATIRTDHQIATYSPWCSSSF